jgi:hypothetical protein
MSLSPDGSFAVPISGPDQRLAWLRALLLKAQGIARSAWAHARVSCPARSGCPAGSPTPPSRCCPARPATTPSSARSAPVCAL